ncbi:uncharacterized protein CIMG_09529 [Coccidioides immitis RS]|uniref:Uncharacterized protein n=1 Tax=Coccidioides immitis (strain RS) TaxID=246410 RepID=J3K2K4_COCIM|nr:uncharacterized protein CIMG_09529 [Coccidioides immitis RS]EAS28325.3 hypothetical protein CIMG_09529 [Coccidioides immitis RS]
MDLLGVYEYAALLMIMMKGSIIIGAQARAKVLEGEKGSFAEVSGRNRRLPYLCVDQIWRKRRCDSGKHQDVRHSWTKLKPGACEEWKRLKHRNYLSVIDFPGPFTNTVEGVTFKEDIRVVQGMILRYMKPRSTMLAAKIAIQNILQRCKDLDPRVTAPWESLPYQVLSILELIESVYNGSKGFEIGPFNLSLLSTLMKSQSTKRGVISVAYVSDTIIVIHQFISTEFSQNMQSQEHFDKVEVSCIEKGDRVL